MKKKLFSALLLLTVLFTFGCKLQLPNKTKSEKILAKVNNIKITQQDLQEKIKQFPQQYQKTLEKPEIKNQLLNQIIDEKLLLKYAKDQNYAKKPEYKKQIKTLKENLIVNLMIQDEIDKKINITEKEIKDYYEKNKSQFAKTKKIKISQIVVKTKKDAKSILAKLEKGAKFSTLAKKNSIHTSKDQGGDLGWFIKNGSLAKELETPAFALKKVGDLSPIIKTSLGYHILKLEAIGIRPTIKLKDVKQSIAKVIVQNKQQQLLNQLIAKLKAQYNVQTFTN